MNQAETEAIESIAHLQTENRLLRTYLATLGDIALAGELPLRELLQRIVEIAKELLHARYAALGVFDERGRVTEFFTAGLTAEERAAIPHLPVGAGLLGYIVRERRIVRCARIADHPASVGFPPNHPVMTSFIGGPISRGDVVYGNLYLADRIGADEFSPEDAEMLALLARQSAVAIENAQRFARARREEQTTRTLSEIGQALSALADPRAVIEFAVRSALDLLGAEVAGLALREDEPGGPGRITWAVLHGTLLRLRQGTSVPTRGSLIGQTFEAGAPLEISDLTTHPVAAGANPVVDQEGIRSLVLVPLSGESKPRGVLMVGWRTPGAIPDGARDVLARLADRVAIALAQAELRAREQAALRQSETERLSLEAIFDSLRDAIVTTDLKGRIVRLNRQANRWAGGDVTGRPIAEVFRLLEEREQSSAHSTATRPEGNDLVLVLPSNEPIPVEHISAPIRDANGEIRGTVQVFRDLRPQREVEQLKANIISLVSHELRTPLSHIKGYASSLLQPDVEWDAETQHDFIASIERQADRLARLINDLLEISRLDAGGTARLEPVAVAPATLIERGLRQAEPFLGSHPVTVDLSPDLPLVRADPNHLERVLSNLVENAAKYSPDGAPITVSVTHDPPVVTFAVTDRGPGLTADEHAHLFERFYRSPRVKHRTPGTGLGLAICKEIIQAHGGRIWAESVEGCGALSGSPCRSPIDRTVSDGSPDARARERLPGREEPMTKTRVLIVDDEPETLKYVGANLRIRGYEVVTAADGSEALQRADEDRFDLILLDITMPGPDGFAVCEAIRRSSAVPIIMLSARGQEKDKVRALNLGADDYITKPFGIEELLARIRTVLRRSQQIDTADRLVIGDLEISFADRRVTRAGEEIKLTPTEYELLVQLVRSAGKVLNHTTLLQRVWGPEYGQETEYLWAYIRRLRRKIEADPEHPRYLLTEPGVGYRFVAKDEMSGRVR